MWYGNEAYYADYFELMRQAAPHAAEMGVNITMKPHGGISLTVEDLIDADGKVNHPAFGICYDPGNIIYYTKGDLRPETDVATIAPKVTTTIIKDCVVEDGVPDVMVTPGEGLVDFETVLNGLVNGGFDGPLICRMRWWDNGGRNQQEHQSGTKACERYFGVNPFWFI